MYYVYILKSSKDGSFYVGYTSNISERLKRHNKGFVKYTKNHLPYELVRAYNVSKLIEAKDLEKKIKNYKSTTRYLKNNRVPPIIYDRD